MAEQLTRLWPLVITEIQGAAAVAAYGPMLGGYIQNPSTAEAQNIATAEAIYVSLVGPSGLVANSTTVMVWPGQTFMFPGALATKVWVNATTPGHRISGAVVQEATTFVPAAGEFPPTTYTTMTKVLGAYLYQQYNDDEDLQAFVLSYNEMAQEYITWFATVMLPVYTNPNVNGSLLDWVAEGLYGQHRPVLVMGFTQDTGPLNTLQLNTLPLNTLDLSDPSEFYLVDDDLFRRVLTWHLLKGDGKLFNVRWLKRRIKRFLTGTDGGLGTTDDTYDVSVTFGPTQYDVNINLQSAIRISTGGALLNLDPLNVFVPNDMETEVVTLPTSPLTPVFKAAVLSGVLELPFQYTYHVNID
jgi:hypothetical protein